MTNQTTNHQACDHCGSLKLEHELLSVVVDCSGTDIVEENLCSECVIVED